MLTEHYVFYVLVGTAQTLEGMGLGLTWLTPAGPEMCLLCLSPVIVWNTVVEGLKNE